MCELRGGAIVHDDAIRLAVDLEACGHVMTEKDGKLVVSNGSTLTAADRAAITRWRWHLLAIAGYEVPA